jgi:hypothetical protein
MSPRLGHRSAGVESFKRRCTLRPIDLAREHGLSAQAVRNYEDAGILPTAERSASGYRRYTPLHVSLPPEY